MVLLRRVIGDALRARRQGQRRTLREVSTAANVSLGYLSEIERGQKEASSELLASICDALGARLSELLREVSDTVALGEQVQGVLVAVPEGSAPTATEPRPTPVDAGMRSVAMDVPVHHVTTEGNVTVSVRQDSPLKATLRTTRRVRGAGRDRDVVCAA
ncbi:Helix-turn-helix domain-containing protein [Micromonospora pattaloongensis]|uniref:Helix-turn-helix domain-containing protein n=1 Tax=Micromonospora pattaloongensis TaxID=405436 RepID=A0A1H3KHV3_9ACTN|nr:helix-turn-helix transcriptional regulator [Micromonospora pattaloongensis]SDY51164.1 Helix-turn-helix domain-containing protein [Micromonospora pattaloongensis]